MKENPIDANAAANGGEQLKELQQVTQAELQSEPTIGVDGETLQIGDLQYTFIDFAGQRQFRTHWKSFFFFIFNL